MLNVSARKCRHIKCENRVTLLKKKDQAIFNIIHAIFTIFPIIISKVSDAFARFDSSGDDKYEQLDLTERIE